MLTKLKISLLTALAVVAGASQAKTLPHGSHHFNVPLETNNKTIEVFTYKPPTANADTPVVFVLTGLKRNAAHYRDSWVENAKKNNLTVIVPEFSNKNYPGVDGYNLGNLTNTASGTTNPRSEWAFTAIDEMFKKMQALGITRQKSYYLFGNSAGCQFVHRMMTFVPESSVKSVICSAAGWWTLPDLENDWPYGLYHAPVKVTPEQLSRYFAKPVLITVGEQDNDPYHRLLRRSYQAITQGDSRLTRAKNYFLTSRQKAQLYKTKFNWSFTSVPGVAHNGAKMSAWAADEFAWFEKHGKFRNFKDLNK